MLQDIFIIAGSVTGALIFLWLVSHAMSGASRKESNDFTGPVVAVVGTTYAVILAFMLSGVWSVFQQAQYNEELEANDLVSMYRLSGQLQPDDRLAVQQLGRRYAQIVLDAEWPAMAEDRMPSEGAQVINQLWDILSRIDKSTTAQSLGVGELMSVLRSLTEHRQIRIMESRERLPGILWMVLIAGGIITVIAACLFGVNNFRFHMLQVLVLTFLISLVLIAIAEIDRPYQGGDVVSPDGFRVALQTFDGMSLSH